MTNNRKRADWIVIEHKGEADRNERTADLKRKDRAEKNTEKNRRNWEKKQFLNSTVKKNRKKGRKKNEWRIALFCTINKICAGENTSRDTSEEPQEPHPECATPYSTWATGKPSQLSNIGPQDVLRTSLSNVPKMYPKDSIWPSWGPPLKVLFDRSEHAPIWRPGDVPTWRPGDFLKWRPGDVLIWRWRDVPGRLIQDVP